MRALIMRCFTVMAEKEPIMSVKEKVSGTGVPEHVARRRVVIASFMGALLEWYDFFILAPPPDWCLIRCFSRRKTPRSGP
jgi:hypothetical protein